MSTAPTVDRLPAVLAASVVLALGVAACGSASSTSSSTAAPLVATTTGSKPELSPAGDIPDDQAYVPYAVPGAALTVKVPEGWSRSAAAGATTFTDKLNAIRVEVAKAATAPSLASVKRDDERKLATLPGYHAGTVTAVQRPAGTAIRVSYLADAAADPVTGKARTDAVERYVFFHRGSEAILSLSGPKGADNVDPWKLVTGSVRWRR